MVNRQGLVSHPVTVSSAQPFFTLSLCVDQVVGLVICDKHLFFSPWRAETHMHICRGRWAQGTNGTNLGHQETSTGTSLEPCADPVGHGGGLRTDMGAQRKSNGAAWSGELQTMKP